MAVNLSPVGGVAAQFFTSTGAVLTGGKLYTYAAGTTTPATAYTTSAGSTAWTNPIVLDAAGRVSGSGEIWLTNGVTYKFVLTDSNDVLIATYDNVTGINSIDASEVPYTPPYISSVTTNVEAKLAQTVSVQDFGAVGDGVTDDTAAIQAAITACIADDLILTGEGTFKLTSSVNFRKACVSMPNATFTIAHAGLGIYIGGNSANPNNPPQHIGSVVRSVGTDAYATPSIRVIGSSCQHITVEFVDYIQLYADTSTDQSGQSYAVQYSSFRVKNCVTLELTTNASTTGNPNQQYINENIFYLNAIQNLLINGTYGHNHNTFNDGNFELGNINMEVGGSNYVNNIRGEQGLTVTFEPDVTDCIVTIGWVSSGHRYPGSAPIIQNRGKMCAVQHLYDLYAPIQPMVGFSYQTLKKVGADYNVLGVSNVTITTDLVVGAFDQFYQTGLIPIDGERTVFELNLYVPGGGVRTTVVGYDSTKTAITPAPDQVTYDGSGNKEFGQASNSSNTVQEERFFILDNECKYIVITVNAAGTGASFDSFYLGARIADIELRKKLAASTFTNNNFV